MSSAPNENLSGIIQLNVGGCRYDVSAGTLLSHGDNMLSLLVRHRNSMMGGQNGEPGNEEIFIDRNGLRFGTILDYMRDRRLPSFKYAWQYEEILMEANFFQLDGLVTLCENVIKELTEAAETVNVNSHWGQKLSQLQTFVRINKIQNSSTYASQSAAAVTTKLVLLGLSS